MGGGSGSVRFILASTLCPSNDFVTKVGSGSTPRGDADVYVPNGSAFLRSQNIQKGVADLSDVVFIDRVAQEELRRALVHTGDVLLNITPGLNWSSGGIRSL